MKNEEARLHRICRIFVLLILGAVVIVFLLVAFVFHAPVGSIGDFQPLLHGRCTVGA